MKSDFIQPILDDFFITEQECATKYPELVVNSELAQGNLEEFVERHEGNL